MEQFEKSLVASENLNTLLGLGAGELLDGLEFSPSDELLDNRANPFLCDIQFAEITVLGHRNEYPNPAEWERVLSQLEEDEELLWVINYHQNKIRLFLGLKSSERYNLQKEDGIKIRQDRFNLIVRQFKDRAFPGSQVTMLPPAFIVDELSQNLNSRATQTTTVAISGVPSPPDAEKEYATKRVVAGGQLAGSLNDVVEAVRSLDSDFTIVISLAKVSRQELASMLADYNSLRTEVSSLLKVTESTGGSKTIGTDESTAESKQEGTGTGEAKSSGHTVGVGFVLNYSNSPSKTSSSNAFQMDGITRQSGFHESSTASTQVSKSYADAKWIQIDENLERYTSQLDHARGTQAFRSLVTINSSDEQTVREIAKLLSGVFSGAETRYRPFQGLTLTGAAKDFLLRTNHKAKDVMPALLAITERSRASMLLLLPDAELQPLKIKRNNIIYSRSSDVPDAGVLLGYSSMPAGEEAEPLIMAEKDLLSHVLVVGTTGAGKTYHVAQILNHLRNEDYRIIVLETAKRTYRDFLFRLGRKPRIFTLGDSSRNPLRINPFFFEYENLPGTVLKQHISLLSQAISELLPMEAMIGPKLREAIELTYKTAGWDIESGLYTRSGLEESTESARFPDMYDFFLSISKISKKLKYGEEVSQNYYGALISRAQVFVSEIYRDIFCNGGNQSLDDLFPSDTVIEMDSLPQSETNMPAFVVSLILARLRRQQQRTNDRKYVIVVEEAHNVLARQSEVELGMREFSGSKYLVNQMVRLLQEGRELGLGFVIIDQSALALAKSVVDNTNTKVIHRIESGEEALELSRSIGLHENAWRDLLYLQEGESVVKMKSLLSPMKTAPFPNDKSLLPPCECGGIINSKYDSSVTVAERVLERAERTGQWLENEEEFIRYCGENQYVAKSAIFDRLRATDKPIDMVQIPAESCRDWYQLYRFRPLVSLYPRTDLVVDATIARLMNLETESDFKSHVGIFPLLEELSLEKRTFVQQIADRLTATALVESSSLNTEVLSSILSNKDFRNWVTYLDQTDIISNQFIQKEDGVSDMHEISKEIYDDALNWTKEGL